jgi:hypothetical protein
MHDYPELSQVWQGMQVQNKFYRPTTFWSEVSPRFLTELYTHSVEPFRSLPYALGFSVPYQATDHYHSELLVPRRKG